MNCVAASLVALSNSLSYPPITTVSPACMQPQYGNHSVTETTNLVLQSGTVRERLEQECEVCDKALVVRNLPVVKTS